MRKLAPMFVFTIATLAGGAAFATTGTTTSMPTSMGDTTRMDGAANPNANQMPQHGATMGMDRDDKSMTEHMTLAQKKKAEKMRMKKAKLARAGDSTMMNRTPTATTNAPAPNATTGSYSGK